MPHPQMVCIYLFGGALEVGESHEECARREILEEAGIQVGPLRLPGLFSHPSRIIEFADGRAVQSVTVCFAAEALSSDVRLSSESSDAQFCTQSDLERLPIVETPPMIIPVLFRPEMWPMLQ